MDNLEDIWQALLSEDRGLIRRVWGDLTDEEAKAVITHLRKIVEDETYSEEQRRAAQAALDAIHEAG
ncbi:MAG: hypothetical protein FJ030_05715 [Chloroflexi bacterium]|nr:hypothetical protein [Chloroflexota bacterium]